MNEVYTIIGFRRYSFEGQDGRSVSGTTLYVTRPQSNVDGVVAEKVNVSSAVDPCNAIYLGMTCSFFYNKYGKVSGISYGG